jgi:hypothetical protein
MLRMVETGTIAKSLSGFVSVMTVAELLKLEPLVG